MRGPRLLEGFLASFVLGVAALTLHPVEEGPRPLAGVVQLAIPQTADLLRNVALFLPFGLALRLRRLPLTAVWTLSLALSASIEVLQLSIPGRYASPWDVLANTLGGGLGGGFVDVARRSLRTGRGPSPRLAAVAGALCMLGLAGAGLLLRPSVPRDVLYAHWSPSLPHLAEYSGVPLHVSLNGVPLPHGRVSHSERVRRALLGDFALVIEATTGPAPDGQGAFFMLTDRRSRGILLVGPDRQDLVVQFRDVGSALGLEPRVLRVDHALAELVEGAEIRLAIERRDRRLCVQLAEERFCDLEVGISRGWSLVAPRWPLARVLHRGLDHAWIAGLFLPLGYARRQGPAWAAIAGACLVGLYALPVPLALAATTTGEGLSALAGLAAGAGLRLGLARRMRRPSAEDPGYAPSGPR